MSELESEEEKQQAKKYTVKQKRGGGGDQVLRNGKMRQMETTGIILSGDTVQAYQGVIYGQY